MHGCRSRGCTSAAVFDQAMCVLDKFGLGWNDIFVHDLEEYYGAQQCQRSPSPIAALICRSMQTSPLPAIAMRASRASAPRSLAERRPVILRGWPKRIEEFPDGHVIACIGDRFVGQLELQVPYGLPTGYVNLFYVAPAWRRLGFGRQLHAFAERYFRSWEATAVELHVSPSNEAAVAFYRSLGYRTVGREDDGERLWKMRARDCSAALRFWFCWKAHGVAVGRMKQATRFDTQPTAAPWAFCAIEKKRRIANDSRSSIFDIRFSTGEELPLGELEPPAGAALAVLFAFLHSAVAGEESAAAEGDFQR